MKIKDFVTIGVLSVIGYLIQMLVGFFMAAFMSTISMYAGVAVTAFLAAPVYIVLCRRVPKRGSVFLYNLVFGLLYALMGYWTMLIFLFPIAIISECVMIPVSKYESNFRIGLSYTIGQIILGIHAGILLWIVGGNGMLELFPGMFNADRINGLISIYYNPVTMAIILLGTIALSFAGIFFGLRIYDKHFAGRKSKAVDFDEA